MQVQLTVTAGPHEGRKFVLDGHDTFLVGRSRDAHFRLPRDDPYFSRRHFLIEANPPRCRLLDLGSHNGTFVNGTRARCAELAHGDEIRAGHTVMRVRITAPAPTPEDATVDYAPEPKRIGGYVLEQEIGRGGMGVVYRASPAKGGPPVALKTILLPPGARRKEAQLFLREASILASLDHPRIVRFGDMGEENGVLYFAMELVVGTTAAKLLEQGGPLPPRTAARLGCQLLRGLAHAHEKGFVHRDVKPSNVLIEVGPDKRAVKLADFGLARAFATSQVSGVTMQGEIGGTVAFMPPEQVTHFRDVQPSADQYSAAATLYRLLTGKTPHDLPKDVGEQLVTIITQPPVPIRQRRPDLPEGLAAAIHKAMAREPERRFKDVAAFYNALAPFARA